MGGPDRLTRIPTITRAYSGGLEACRYRSILPGKTSAASGSFSYLTSRQFIGHCTRHSQSTVLSILCRGVELGIPSVERCQRVSTLREEEPLRRTSMQSRSNITATTERATRIIRCRAAFRRRETISREWGDDATPGPTTCELRNSLPLPPGSPRETDALGTRPRVSESESRCGFVDRVFLRYPTRVPAECIGEILGIYLKSWCVM